MSGTESDRKREQECLRLASDLIQLATTKARLRTKKPLSVRYAELKRLRQAIIEAQSAKLARKERLAPKQRHGCSRFRSPLSRRYLNQVNNQFSNRPAAGRQHPAALLQEDFRNDLRCLHRFISFSRL
jgi:hypothetical protein